MAEPTNDDLILSLLKADLLRTGTAEDALLNHMISQAKAEIATEGIILEECDEDNALVRMYAAELYRRSRGQVADNSAAMNRMLRYNLNNRLFSRKARSS